MARVTTWLFVESESASVDEMSKTIGLQCDTSRRKGEPLTGRPGRTARANLWRLDNRKEIPDDPEVILRQIVLGLQDILSRISGHEEGFEAVRMSGESGLLVGVLAKSTPPIVFDAAILRAVANLNVDLELDLTIG